MGVFLMKRYALLITICMLICCEFAFADTKTVNLAHLEEEQLENIIGDVDYVIKQYHSTTSSEDDALLKTVKGKVESLFAEKEIKVSWPWFDYSYGRDRSLYWIRTHIDYRDNGGSYKPDIYAVLLKGDDGFNICFLQIGNEIIIDEMETIPEGHWVTMPDAVINEETGVNLVPFDIDDLNRLKNEVNNEIKRSHRPNDTVSSLVLSLTKSEVENYYAQQSIKVSWPWFDYSYYKDWKLYELYTRIGYNDGKRVDLDVYSAAFKFVDKYELVYLEIGDMVLIDRTNELPETFYDIDDENIYSFESDDEFVEKTSDGGFELTQEQNDVPEAITAVESENEPTATLEPTATPEPVATPAPTATPEPILIQKGEKSEIVKHIQEKLIVLGYLNGSADGDFGPMTENAVKAFQKSNQITETGIITNKEIDKIDNEMKELYKRAAVVAMTNAQATDVFTADGNNYDKNKFHSWSDVSGFYLTIHDMGTWKKRGDDTWRIDKMVLRINGTKTYIKVSMLISFSGDKFEITWVEKVIAKLENLDSNDPAKTSGKMNEPIGAPYLTIPLSLVKAERVLNGNTSSQNNGESSDSAKIEEWIDDLAFSFDHSIPEFNKMIKKMLNDEKSFKHISTDWLYISDDDLKKTINELLKEYGFSSSVSVGDYLIMTEFSAKNAYNATIKSMAYGIASHSNKSLYLIGIE